jgi:hypothetical protein
VRSQRFARRPLVAAVLVVLGSLPAPPASAYADRAGTDVVIDAPWRTVRDYVPVLFFFPHFERGRRVESIRVLDYSPAGPPGPPAMVDRRAGPDTLNGTTFVGAMGEPRGGITDADRIGSFWHYVARVPLDAFHLHAGTGVRYLYAEVEWTRPGPGWRRTFHTSRVLRVLVQHEQFPGFDAADRYFDAHVHTIAEQTTGAALDVNWAHKAYGGPVIMLLEASYALGLVQRQPGEDDGRAYRDSLIVTDHNVFYSTRPYEAGDAPRAGPTAGLANGDAAEAAWFRENLGQLAGEEITLRRGSLQDGSIQPNLGHHLLSYDTRHFEGPWHGGLFLTSRLENPNTLTFVLQGARAAGPGGFFYSAHPGLAGFDWPPEYFAQGIGFSPYDSRGGPLVDPTGSEFLLKGSQVWNSKPDEASRSSHLPASSAFDAMNPFAGGPEAQRFRHVPWDAELNRSLDTLFAQIGRGLAYSFREAPTERFVRKLYLSAGSDAHGDFNYADEVPATAVPYSGFLHSNAYARVRTYALAHERPEGARDPVDAFREGNTVITDGPLLSWCLDADGRFDPRAGARCWHDAESRWENVDGRIGGAGPFDGGCTALVPAPGGDAWIRSRWELSVTPGAGAIRSLRFDRVLAAARDSFRVDAGHPDAPGESRVPAPLDRLCALVATARDTAVDERCITNPVWVAPVAIEIVAERPQRDAGRAGTLPPGSLRVRFRFPFSMSSSSGTRVVLRALDGSGNSTDPAIELPPASGWESEGGVATARLTVTNGAAIPLPPDDWDAAAHAPTPGVASFVVCLERPADVHGNVLNDVARAFAVPRRAEDATAAPR